MAVEIFPSESLGLSLHPKGDKGGAQLSCHKMVSVIETGPGTGLLEIAVAELVPKLFRKPPQRSKG